MSRNPATLKFINCPGLGSRGSLEHVLDAVEKAEFEIKRVSVWASETEEVFSVYRLEEALGRMFIAYELQTLSFLAMDSHRGTVLPLSFEIGWSVSDTGKVRQACLSAASHHTVGFTSKESDPELHAGRLLYLANNLYQLVRPPYGWIERLPTWNPLKAGYTTWEDVEELKLPHLYWANFFGPAYVEKVGKEFLKQAPGWKCEELDDGGLLYVLTPSLAGTGPVAVVREVQSYFGVEHVRRRPRKPRRRAKK